MWRCSKLEKVVEDSKKVKSKGIQYNSEKMEISRKSGLNQKKWNNVEISGKVQDLGKKWKNVEKGKIGVKSGKIRKCGTS